MPNIHDIKLYMKTWSRYTYKQGLDKCYTLKKDSQVYKFTVDVLRLQKLENKFMDGNSVQKIPLKKEGKTNIIFSEIYWELMQDFFSPANYVVAIVRKCIDENITDINFVAKVVGRGLRALPAFFREMDLADKLTKVFADATTVSSPTQDVKEHTDIYVKSDRYEYRIWSYQNFKWGLNNTADRIRGNRGDIPNGIHVLCPINIKNEVECEEVEGWFFYSDKYVQYLYDMITIERADDYSIIREMNEKLIYSYLKKANIIEKREDVSGKKTKDCRAD